MLHLGWPHIPTSWARSAMYFYRKARKLLLLELVRRRGSTRSQDLRHAIVISALWVSFGSLEKLELVRKQYLCARAACFLRTSRGYSFRTPPRQPRWNWMLVRLARQIEFGFVAVLAAFAKWSAASLRVFPACPLIQLILQVEIREFSRASRLSNISLSGSLSFSLMFDFS
jgi:hypothetical protein